MCLFSQFRIGPLTLRNRIILAPMLTDYATEDMRVSNRQLQYYADRARGGAALLIAGGVAVNKARRVSPNALGIYEDSLIPSLKRLADVIHTEGSLLCVQLVDSLRMVGRKVRDLNHREIRQLVGEFAKAALRAKQGGCDAIEFHMAHSHTLADFLSKRGNQRTDEYGGNVERRVRIAEEILQETRRLVGPNFPISCRINGDEFIVGGNTLKDAQIIAQRLVERGASMIHVSAGGRLEDGGRESYSRLRSWPTRDMPDATNTYLAGAIKRAVPVPVIAVGKVGSAQLAEDILGTGEADLIALGRPLLADPTLPVKWQNGRHQEIARCTYCNECVRVIGQRHPIRCVLWSGSNG